MALIVDSRSLIAWPYSPRVVVNYGLSSDRMALIASGFCCDAKEFDDERVKIIGFPEHQFTVSRLLATNWWHLVFTGSRSSHLV